MELNKYNYVNIEIRNDNNILIIQRTNSKQGNTIVTDPRYHTELSIANIVWKIGLCEYIHELNIGYNNNILEDFEFKDTIIKTLVVYSLDNIDNLLSKFKKVKIIGIRKPQSKVIKESLDSQLKKFKGDQQIHIYSNKYIYHNNDKITYIKRVDSTKSESHLDDFPNINRLYIKFNYTYNSLFKNYNFSKITDLGITITSLTDFYDSIRMLNREYKSVSVCVCVYPGVDKLSQIIESINAKNIVFICYENLSYNNIVTLINKPNIKTLDIVFFNDKIIKLDNEFDEIYTILRFIYVNKFETHLPYHIFKRNMELYKRKRFIHTKAIVN